MWIYLSSTRKAVTTSVVWIFVAMAYFLAVRKLTDFTIGPIVLSDIVGFVSIKFFGEYRSLLELELLVMIICGYKIINAIVDGLLMSFVNVALIGSIAYGFSIGVIEVMLDGFGITANFSVNLLIIFVVILAGYCASLALDLLNQSRENQHPECFDSGIMHQRKVMTYERASALPYVAVGIHGYCQEHPEHCQGMIFTMPQNEKKLVLPVVDKLEQSPSAIESLELPAPVDTLKQAETKEAILVKKL